MCALCCLKTRALFFVPYSKRNKRDNSINYQRRDYLLSLHVVKNDLEREKLGLVFEEKGLSIFPTTLEVTWPVWTRFPLFSAEKNCSVWYSAKCKVPDSAYRLAASVVCNFDEKNGTWVYGFRCWANDCTDATRVAFFIGRSGATSKIVELALGLHQSASDSGLLRTKSYTWFFTHTSHKHVPEAMPDFRSVHSHGNKSRRTEVTYAFCPVPNAVE